jgi:hypothetical protein
VAVVKVGGEGGGIDGRWMMDFFTTGMIDTCYEHGTEMFSIQSSSCPQP